LLESLNSIIEQQYGSKYATISSTWVPPLINRQAIESFYKGSSSTESVSKHYAISPWRAAKKRLSE